MSAISTAIRLNDQMTSILQGIVNSLNMTVAAMDDVGRSMDEGFDDTSIKAAQSAVRNMEAELRRMEPPIQEAEREQRNFNNAVERGEMNVKGLVGGLLAAVGAYKAFQTAKDVLSDSFSRGIEFHAFRQASEVAFTTFLGDAERATQYMDDMYQFALKTPFAYPDLLESSRNLIAFGIQAEKTFPIMQAIGDAVAAVGGGNAEMQNLANIFGQIQAQGRLTMMEVNRLSNYGINALEMIATQSGMTAEEIRQQMANGALGAEQAIAGLVAGMNDQFGGLMEGVKGTWRGAIDSLNSARRNAGAAMMEDFMEPLTDTIGVITQMFRNLPTYIGPAVDAFLPLIVMFNEAFAEGKLDAYFAAFGAGLTFIAELLSKVGQMAISSASFFVDNWSMIAPIVTSIVVALGSYLAITKAITIAQNLWNLAMKANPIMLVVTLIGTLIGVLISLWKTNDKFAAAFMRAWNGILNFFNQIPIFFTRIGHAIANVFDNIKVSILNAMEDAVNGVINGINKLINTLNILPFVSLSAIEQVGFGAEAEIEAEAKRQAREANLQAMEEDAMLAAEEREQRVLDMLNERARERAQGDVAAPASSLAVGAGLHMPEEPSVPDLDWNFAGLGYDLNIDEIGKVGEVGKIRDSVDISSEDLKMMRELADMRNIQNFVTLTPQISFGDMHIREESDIDTIIARIEDYVEEQRVASTDGSYA